MYIYIYTHFSLFGNISPRPLTVEPVAEVKKPPSRPLSLVPPASEQLLGPRFNLM